jgi:hypothetical protein
MKPNDVPTPKLGDAFQTQGSPTSACYVTAVVLPNAPTRKHYTDQTGSFPCTSSSVHNYILVTYHYDTNVTLVKPLQNVPPSNIINEAMFWALHSTAINSGNQLVAESNEVCKCSDSKLWIQESTEEFSQLAQGLGKDSNMSTVTNIIFFIHPSQMPNGCKAMYLQIVCAD